MGFGRYRFRRSFGQVKSMFRGAIPKHFPLFKGLLGLYPGAAAAYSLRALKSEKDSVVRVRRESDNDEKDFTASDVSSGVLTNWVNTQIVPPLDIGVETVDGRVPVSEGGTSIGEPAAAYSLRNLKPSYTSAVVDVRRSSDNATASFNADDVADGTLEDWVGSGNDGYVSKWYDQSTNANHAEQASEVSQPKIVDGGALVTGGLSFDGVNDGLYVVGQVLTSSSFYATSVIQHSTGTSTSNSQNVFGQYQLGVSGRFQLAANNTSQYSFFANATDSISGLLAGGIGTSQTLISVNADGSNAEIFRDGTSRSTDTYSGFTPATVDFTIGIDAAGEREFNGKITELIVYPSDQSDNRTAIEANIGETYSIAGIPAYDNTVNGFVETWYDQSGSGKNAVQLTAGNQPKIVDGGALVTGGIDFNGVDDKMDIPGLSPASLTYSAFTVASIDNFAATSLKSIFDTSDLDDGGFAISYGNTANKLTPFWFDGDDSTANVFSGGSNLTNLESLYSLIIKTGASTTNINGSLNETLTNSFSSAGTNNLSKSTIAYDQSTPSRLLNGKLNELIIYDTDQSVNRTGIEDNINNYYNIY